jgi:loricrin
MDDLKAGRVTSGYLPGWYHGPDGSGSGIGGGGGWAPGLMSGSAIPNFGGMMAALGTIGNSPSSSGGGGGGFGGGSSGGGGGGAGGGF